MPLLLIIYVNGLLVNITGTKLLRLLVSLCAIVLVCEGTRYLVYNSQRWFNCNRRILFINVVGLSCTTLILAGSAILREYITSGRWQGNQILDTQVIVNEKNLTIGIFGYAFVNAVVSFYILFLAYEFMYRQALLTKARQQKEKLEKEKLKAELLQLKGIVNPHFLFNNLNSLSSLISESPERAQEFLNELTQVFRYLLRNNQAELTTLAEELKFIQTYYQLLQKRYGQAIQMLLKVDKVYESLQIPPLTLQLLVENAVKHNRLQKDNPLYIEIVSAPDQKLIVRNNIFKKESRVESTGIGLQTINARYAMLNSGGVLIEKTEQSFSVIISLLKEEQVPVK